MIKKTLTLYLCMFQSVVLFASNYVLVALSVDRLDAIARPMNFSGSGQYTGSPSTRYSLISYFGF